jgi:hypothetical protein
MPGGERRCYIMMTMMTSPALDPVVAHPSSRKRDRDDGLDSARWPETRLRPLTFPESDPLIEGVYAVSNQGRVRDPLGRIYDAHVRADGYLMAQIAGMDWYHHLLVYFKFYARKPDGEIDHVDRKKSNNDPWNLEDVTGAENMRRSNVNPNRRSNAEKVSRPVVGTLGDDAPRGFPSATVAARELGLHKTSVTSCCQGRADSTGGWKFAYAVDTDYPGEVWRRTKTTEWINVSNLGRVQTETSGRYYPNPGTDGYCRVSGYRVHRLVMQAFSKPDESNGRDVDHRDNITTHNHIGNLRWVTPAENNAKRRPATKLSTRRAVRIVSSTGTTIYDSVELAAAAIGLYAGRVRTWCASGKPHRVHGVLSYVEVMPKDGEIFKNVTEDDLAALGRKKPHARLNLQ